jgi:AraC-like DNA-binding protein
MFFKSKWLYFNLIKWAVGLFLLVSHGVFSQNLKIEVEVFGPLLEPSKDIFIALDYNQWHPGDSKYRLKREGGNLYSVELINPPSVFEYKFTQGTWMFVEGTPDGQSLPNRSYDNKINVATTLKTSILGWEKQVVYDLFIEDLPTNTPKDSKIFISGNFNNWETGDPNYELKKNNLGHYVFKLFSDLPKIEYKYNRGTWESVESKKTGKARPNRIIYRDSAINNKAVVNQIDGWEDLLGTLHVYSLFDFLLLFSVFQGLLLLIAIPIIQKSNLESNRWLLASILVSSASILFYILSGFQVFVHKLPLLVLLPDLIYFLYGPFFFFYLLSLLFHTQKLPVNWYLFFIPFLLQFFVYLPFFIQNDKTLLLDLMNQKPTLQKIFGITGVLGLLWNIYFWFLFNKTIQTYKKQFQTTLSYEHNMNFLNTVLIVQFLVLCFWAFSIIINAVSNFTKLENTIISENSVDIIWLVFSLITYLVGYYAIHQTDVIKVYGNTSSVFDDPLEKPISEIKQNEGLKDENIKKEIEKLENYFKKNKPYLNPRISLNELSHEIGISGHLLSKIINDHYNQNFFDFINSHRVEEFKIMVKDPKNHNITFLGLAYEVGFNSKTAFNRAFKKITNQTPREYMDSLESP